MIMEDERFLSLPALYEKMGIKSEIYDFGEMVLEELKPRFDGIDQIAEYNQMKVLNAMQEHRVSAEHFNSSSGYGYDDAGRDTLEAVYASVFHTESALVRPQIVSGTHALATALFGVLRPGDELLSIGGKPYDTMEEVIGIRQSPGSLKEFGVTYAQAELFSDGSFDYDEISELMNERTKLILIQRSKGYQTRPSFSVGQIGEAIAFVKEKNPDVIVMVDNCYGEFVDVIEPSDVGADLVVGSLIKNPGGGLAEAGGYIVGRKDLIDLCSYRLTAPGIGKEVGANFGVLRHFYQGLFLAPTVVASALKGAIFAASLYEKLGFRVIPGAEEERNDIIQAIEFGCPEGVLAFCKGIQAAAPVDSYVTPEGSDMPGYEAPVVMAAGAFVQGASIELSADGPLSEPYAVYFQGGLTWQHAKYGILRSLQEVNDQGITPPEHEDNGYDDVDYTDEDEDDEDQE
jgi:cystathionine beta-lyase family protein involved in aluminum resistance